MAHSKERLATGLAHDLFVALETEDRDRVDVLAKMIAPDVMSVLLATDAMFAALLHLFGDQFGEVAVQSVLDRWSVSVKDFVFEGTANGDS